MRTMFRYVGELEVGLLNVTPDYVDQEVHLMFPQYFTSNLESGQCPYPDIMAVNDVAFTMSEDSGYIYNYSLGSH